MSIKSTTSTKTEIHGYQKSNLLVPKIRHMHNISATQYKYKT